MSPVTPEEAAHFEDCKRHPDYFKFRRALAENPGDDTTRLVFADWLQEQGCNCLAAQLREYNFFAATDAFEKMQIALRPAAESLVVAFRLLAGALQALAQTRPN